MTSWGEIGKIVKTVSVKKKIIITFLTKVKKLVENEFEKIDGARHNISLRFFFLISVRGRKTERKKLSLQIDSNI